MMKRHIVKFAMVAVLMSSSAALAQDGGQKSYRLLSAIIPQH
jgi:hypothetical protein